MNRRQLFAGAGAAALAAVVPAPPAGPAPVFTGLDTGARSGDRSIWLVCWGTDHIEQITLHGNPAAEDRQFAGLERRYLRR